jgi:hypothetical protein
VPFIQTTSSLAQALIWPAAALVGAHVSADLVAGLETITQSTVRFVEACRTLGVAGIYYAIQYATPRAMSETEYRSFGEPHDRQVLAAAADFWFNMGHLHGPDPMFDLVAQYPLHALNWHDREGPPSLAEGAPPGACRAAELEIYCVATGSVRA